MRFRVVYRGRKLTVTITHECATYRLEDGEPLDIRHHGRQVTVDHSDLVLEIPPGPQPEPVRQPVGCQPRRRARP
jgi:alpha,alpha-trehalose phosphorylase